jgi:hypothetical protein
MRQLIFCLSILVAPFTAVASESCAADFLSFLSKFEAQVEFQKQHTRFPLLATYVDGLAEPEPKTVAYKIKNADDAKYKRVLYPSREKQSAVPFKKSVTAKSQTGYFVQFTKPGTDYSLGYFFEKGSDCWRLVKFEDYSL